MSNRIWVSGYSGASKTTFSKEIAHTLKLEHIKCDDFINKSNWAEMPLIIIDYIKDRDNYILDGIVCGRICRKVNELGLDIRPTEYYFLTDLFRETTVKQNSLNKGLLTIHKQVEPILADWGIDCIYEIPEKSLKAVDSW